MFITAYILKQIGKKSLGGRKAFFSLALLLVIGQVYSQTPAAPDDIRLVLDDTAVVVQNEQLVDISIKIENDAQVDFEGILKVSAGEGVKIISKDQINIKVEKGKSIFFSAKVFVLSSAKAGKVPVYLKLSDSKTLPREAKLDLILPGKKDMRIHIDETSILLPEKGEMLNVPVHIENLGNTTQQALLVVAFPTQLGDKTNKAIHFALRPFSDTVITVSRKTTGEMYRLEDFYITITGIYANGEYFSTNLIAVQTAKSSRKYGTKYTNGFNQYTPNSITIGAQNISSANEAYFIRGAGDFELDKGRLGFSLNATKWKDPSTPALVNNTWIDYEYKGLGARLGNIVNTGEVNLNGRGVEAYYSDTSIHKRISVGYLDKSYNLIDNNANFSFGQSAWASVAHDKNRLRASSMVVYDTDPYYQTRSIIWVNEGGLKISDRLIAQAKVGAANSLNTENTKEQRGSFMLSGGLNGYLSKNVSISSDNYYSSGYFPGTRRGVFSLNERINWNIGESTLWIAGSRYNYAPQYLQIPGSVIFGTNTTTENGELGIMRSLGKSAKISLAPAWYREQGNWSSLIGQEGNSMEAWRLGGSFIWLNPVSKQNLTFRIDAGRYTTTRLSGYQWQYRGSLAWSYDFFKLTLIGQRGDFFLAETFRTHGSSDPTYRINISPSLSQQFFRKKLLAEGGMTYYQDNSVKSLFYTAQLSYNLGKTRFFANVQYNTVNSTSSYNNIQAGITRYFYQAPKEEKNNKCGIELFVFRDYNSNGVFDGGDSIVAGHLVVIENTIFATDDKGMIYYKKLPPGNYKVTLPIQKGWYAADRSIELAPKGQAMINIPLQQTGALVGTITFEYDELLSYAVGKQKGNQTIIATNSQGNTITTRTDENGQYILYLPAETYTVSIINLPSQIECANNNQKVAISSGTTTSNINFKLKVKQRKLEVKKFGGK